LLTVCKELRWQLLAVAAVLAMCVLAPSAGAAGPMYTGVEIYKNDANNMTANVNLAFTKAQEAGTNYVRLVLSWREVSPTNKPANTDFAHLSNPSLYTWGTFDTYVQQALSNGLKPMITIWQAPSWAGTLSTTDPSSFGMSGSVRPDPAMFGAFAAAAAAHYQGLHPGVHFAWEAWNEPNQLFFLQPQKNSDGSWASPGIYRALLNRFYNGIRSVDPLATVVGGSTAPFGNNKKPGALLFLRKVLCLSSTNLPVSGCQGNVAHADVWSTHPYTEGGPTHKAISPNAVSLGDLPRWHAAIKAGFRYGHLITTRSSVQAWVTEFGWDSKGPDIYGVPLALHARWTSEALYRAWRAGIPVFIFHQLRDRPFKSDAYQSGMFYCGIAALTDDDQRECEGSSFSFANDVKKPSWRATYFPFVAFAANGRITIWGRTPGSIGGQTVVIERKTLSGSFRRMFAIKANSLGIFTKRFASSLTRGSLRARIGDVSSGTYSVPFSLTRVKDRPAKPWGCGGPLPC
jgi:hypothetical protein